ncbi:hypothetical protein ABIC47_003479 [Leifsonia sp. 563]|uniref:hypothetical protein n=1 Tax=Leifsonia sp. 563 TaxID=3156412 RepID=UPI00339AF44A
MNNIDLDRFESEMWSAVDELEQARRAVDEATRRLAEQRERTNTVMQRYGGALAIEDRQVPQQVVRSLYWEHRDIHAQAIADAFALKGGGGRVHEYAGSEPFETPCAGGCGRPVRLVARTSSVPTCPECAARIEAERQAHFREVALHHQKERQEREEWARRQMLEGRTPEELYVEMTERWVTGGPLPWLKDLAAELETEERGANLF